MSGDIVTRLRSITYMDDAAEACRDAAAEIERLRAEGGWGTTKQCDTCAHFGVDWGDAVGACGRHVMSVTYDFFCAEWQPKDGG